MENTSISLSSPAASPAAELRSADTTLIGMVILALLVLFAAPTRLFYIPFGYDGDYMSVVPPNLIDLAWIGVGAALYVRAGMGSARAPLALAGLILLGAVGIMVSGAEVPEELMDLLTFNSRMVGGLVLGALFFRAGVSASLFCMLMFAGAVIVALSTVYLSEGGGASYDFYDQMQRYGGMGLAPNEASIVFAGALNMIPLLFKRRPWLVLAVPVLIVAILMTGSRTGVILALAGSVFWLALAGRVARRRGGKVLMAVGLVVALIVAWTFWQDSRSAPSSAVVVENRLENPNDVSNIGRLELYVAVPTYVLAHPEMLLVGVGGSNAAVESFLRGDLGIWTGHTHNLFLQLLTAYGISGIVVAGALIGPLLRRRARYADTESLALRWFGLTLVAGQMVQYALFEVKFLLAFTMTVGFLAAQMGRRSEVAAG